MWKKSGIFKVCPDDPNISSVTNITNLSECRKELSRQFSSGNFPFQHQATPSGFVSLGFWLLRDWELQKVVESYRDCITVCVFRCVGHPQVFTPAVVSFFALWLKSLLCTCSRAELLCVDSAPGVKTINMVCICSATAILSVWPWCLASSWKITCGYLLLDPWRVLTTDTRCKSFFSVHLMKKSINKKQTLSGCIGKEKEDTSPPKTVVPTMVQKEVNVISLTVSKSWLHPHCSLNLETSGLFGLHHAV